MIIIITKNNDNDSNTHNSNNNKRLITLNHQYTQELIRGNNSAIHNEPNMKHESKDLTSLLTADTNHSSETAAH